jgi:signal transduction histidine kinase/DNA-binding response OmpR family regulator
MVFFKRAIDTYIENRLTGNYSPALSYLRISVGCALFIALLFVQTSVDPVYRSFIAQLQVLISIYLTVSIPFKGFITAIVINVIEMIVVADIVFVVGYKAALPGIILPFFTIITITVVYYFGRSLFDKNRILFKQRDELFRAKNEAETAARAKSDFLSAMSHEIRTPMNSILGYIEMMPTDNLTKEQKNHLSVISSNAHDLISIINDILDFTKIERDKLVLESVPFNPARKISLVLKLFELKAKEKGITVTFHHNNAPFCNGDPLRLGQVITNLVGNALKFTPDGGRIDVILDSKVEGDMCFFNIEVRDTGIGIAPEKQKMIFEAFTQSDPTIIEKYGGTGLGLTICSQIVNLMEGKLLVESAPGKGSRFYFSIKMPLAAISEEPHKTMDDLIELFPEKKYTALVAEDAPDSLNLLLMMLEKLRITADGAVNGKEAFDLFRKRRYDVVILDGNMPVMNGTEAARAIRKYEKEKKAQPTPIVALSAKVLISEKEEFRKAGADSFVEKPVFLKTLAESLHSVLNSPAGEIIPSGASAGNDILSRMTAEIGISRETARMIISEFFGKSLPEYLENIRDAVTRKNLTDIELCAHRLKGAAASIFLNTLADECRVLEFAARSGNDAETAASAERVYRKALDAQAQFEQKV